MLLPWESFLVLGHNILGCLAPLGWVELGWVGLGWVLLGWVGLGWVGVEWGWVGVEWGSVVFYLLGLDSVPFGAGEGGGSNMYSSVRYWKV